MKPIWIPANRWLSLLAVLVGGAARLFAAAPEIVVERHEPEIEYRVFDPANPPAEMPKLKPPEIGLCVSEFGCHVRMQTSTPSERIAQTTITSVTIATELKITIWTRVNGDPRELRHEEGHRAISEAYYRGAPEVARLLADDIAGKRLFRFVKLRSTPGKSDDERVKEALQQVQSKLIEDYLAATHWRCVFAQECFDAITDHGRNEIGERDAVVQAIAEEQASLATRTIADGKLEHGEIGESSTTVR